VGELRHRLPRRFERGWLRRRSKRHHRVSGGAPSAPAAKAATSIVFTTGGDPVRNGFVTSVSRSGGNITDVFFLVTVLARKRLDLLRALIPEVPLIAVLLNPNQPDHAGQVKEVQEAARALGQQIHIVLASNESAIAAAFATAAQSHAGAMSVGSDAFFNSQRDKIIALAARHSIPAAYEGREFALVGGLMSYGTSHTEAYRQVGMYAGHIRAICRSYSPPNSSS
jgi:putative ABC transport system substrate-binding protein